MICEGCKFADWKRTANGRLHPDGYGKCKWEKTFRIAGSCRSGIWGTDGQPITLSGGTINRKKGEEHPVTCDTFQRAKA